MSADKVSLDGLRIDRTAIPKKERPAWLLPTVVILLVVAGGITWWSVQPKPLAVDVAVAKEQSSGAAPTSTTQRAVLNGSGYVTARRIATVSAKVTGKVMEVLVEEGMKVEQDQIVARLDASNTEASLRLAEAQLDSARKTLEETKPNAIFAGQELKRFKELAQSKAASQSDLNKADAEVNALAAKLVRQTADVVVAEREVAQWKQQVDDTIVRAPFTGIVTSKNAQPGEMISPMSAGGSFTRTGICTIVDMNSLEIEVDVSESYINRVQAGQPVEAKLDAYSDWKIPAKVIAIIPTADRQKATVKVRIGFDKLDSRILPEMGVKVAFQSAPQELAASTESKHASQRLVIVPKEAVHQDGGKDVAWVVKDGRVERRAITVNGTDAENTTVTAGLSAGERLVLNAPTGLKDGAKVTEKKS
ncbi:efflux RND transporter periplasmic adaptor subunit [Roseimicrobium sp. ORNL1]|uniref:efflux RND transporter periplasmic adaptor subunit n=1 Tax=Roseimicrobium sp. ORNL1 TaxID=2711231 RepID=UPI0013E1464F|nr:efflux RND transporter periplasmic adaptor subunit [Roseimicrobium sp. ORNL1]QIF02532.1 efflux RND transporter periplasmic adaptor subunit [Roseimicrobium sp. ORNL1]